MLNPPDSRGEVLEAETLWRGASVRVPSAGQRRARGRGRLATLREGARHLAERAFQLLGRAASVWTLRVRGARLGSGEEREGAFTTEERRLLEALSELLLPSSEGSPGAREAEVVRSIELALEASPRRSVLYSRGLKSLDGWASKRKGRPFLELAEEERLELLRQLDRLFHAWFRNSDGKALRKASSLYHGVRFPVLRLFPVLVTDVMREFYSSPVAWKWLGYDGPPMPDGYPDVTRPRREP